MMTITSVVLGWTFRYIDEILPFRNVFAMGKPLGDIELVASFGVSALIDASSSEGLRAEEERKEAEQAVSEFSGKGARILAAASTVISNFLLVFVAEWEDKSFFSITASSPLRVIGGALAGHGAATLIAVSGGSLLGAFLSEKIIAYTGGVLFLVFASITLIEIIRG
ncbi:Protein pam71, chloroplastic [Ancistrocladus abbreviatus]